MESLKKPYIFIILTLLTLCEAVEYKAYLSQHGLHGTVTFTQNLNGPLTIRNELEGTLQFPTQVWQWSLHEFPVDYTHLTERCTPQRLGNAIYRLDEKLGNLCIPENSTAEYAIPESEMPQVFSRSLLLVNDNGDRVCFTLSLTGDKLEKTATARFHAPISGNVHFRWFSTKDHQKDMLIMTDLFHVRNVENFNKTVTPFTEHKWKILTTDILDSDVEKNEINCNILQSVFDPAGLGDGKGIGDIDARLGMVKISTDYNRRQFKKIYRDVGLELLSGDLTGPQRRLFLVIYETHHVNSFLGCAKIQYDHPVNAKVVIQSSGITGDIRLSQRNRFEPTFLNFNLTTARGDVETKLIFSSTVKAIKIHELPMIPSTTVEPLENPCLTTKTTYDPLGLNLVNPPPDGYGTQDQYKLGDLSGKLYKRNNSTLLVDGTRDLSGIYWDIFLPLIGSNSVVHRSIVIYKSKLSDLNDGYNAVEPWICGAIALYEPNYRYQKQMATAQIIFRYPLVGRILLRQVKDEPWMDTSIIVEYLVHADGSAVNNSMNHRWAIHENPPGKDFYNWTARCLSAGNIYNPYKIDYDNLTFHEDCNRNAVGVCRLGDLGNRLVRLDIAGRRVDSDHVTRKLLTDTFLPLSGRSSVIGKSFVMYDDFGPVARGERLACSIIGGVYRRKAVVRDWFPNGNGLATAKGKIEFLQQTEYDITNVEVSLEDLNLNSGYHIHMTPVEENLEFPCESSSLYDHFNPRQVDPETAPRSYHGTTDQYELGDLSGKFGTLDNQTIFTDVYNDTMLPLFGRQSILGRSVIIHKKKDNQRWACSTIERGYSPSEARELRGIASFHHPSGFAYGYLRMTQLIYNDGSMSETIIEVKLRHPGKHDRNVTRDHNFAIFVNPVGVDAAVQTQATRCVAGGYVWNPFYTQLADPLNEDLYNKECGPENPLRCYVGDLSGRLGTIDIGVRRKVFSDVNFPLEGPVSAMGRSIVIKSPNRRPERYACANIEPDNDIIKYANIEKPPRFVLAQFIEDVREVMGVPEWFLTVDSRKTKNLHGNACVQILLHFKGPIAGQLEQDFSRLLNTGRLESPSLYVPGYINTKRKPKIAYKLCGVRDPNEKKPNRRKNVLGIGSYSRSSRQEGATGLLGIALLSITITYHLI